MTLQEVCLSVLVLMAVTAVMAGQLAVWGDLAQAELAAAGVERIARAGRFYMALNRAALLTRLADGGTLELTAADLKAAGVLANGVPERSPWGQDYLLRLWRRQDEGVTGSGDGGLSGFAAAAGGGDGDVLALPGERRPARAARRLERGFWKPPAAVLAAMGVDDASALVGAGGLRVPGTAYGVTAEELPAGSFGRFLAVEDGAGGVDASRFLNRVGNGSPGRVNTALSAMETDLDMGANRVANVASLRFSPVDEGLVAFDGEVAASQDAVRAACAAGVLAGEDGETASADLEGMTIADSGTGLWRCQDGALIALSDSRGSVLIKAITLVPYDTTIPVPTTCPPGSARTVYAIPASTAVKEVATADGSYAERENDALLYFGTAAQEVEDGDGSAHYDFPAAIDLSCPDGSCPATDHNFDNLVIVACQYSAGGDDAEESGEDGD